MSKEYKNGERKFRPFYQENRMRWVEEKRKWFVISKYGEWLGTHMIGYNVTEIIIETVLGRKLETTYHEVLNSIHPHPTISESVKDAIEVAYGEAIHL